ncbi:hypothetical protein HA49_01570 [Tatumella morbirosei]|uniref:Uncharacterized protein n=1 Tax=Tatumella morbirosei TaxID=642227 RepID=A0A095UZI3_9GAMM|nr:hypothetical protein [Tatumella morbirosei]KGD79688.1 hypothetical protein HA49_01570 [Tatumella morbirosei]
MKRKNHPAQVADSDIRIVDSTPDPMDIKPPYKAETFSLYMLTHPDGITALDTNARTFEDFEKNGTGKQFYTTCLHTDVAKLRNQYGVDVSGEPVKYVSRHGYSTNFTSYRIADRKAAARAVVLVNRWRTERGECHLPAEYSQQLINQFPDTADLK